MIYRVSSCWNGGPPLETGDGRMSSGPYETKAKTLLEDIISVGEEMGEGGREVLARTVHAYLQMAAAEMARAVTLASEVAEGMKRVRIERSN